MTDITTDPTSSDETPSMMVPRWLTSRQLELVSVIVMSLTAVLTAWSGFQNVLMTVLFATVLFFASISGKLTSNHNRAAILAVAPIGLMAGIIILLTYPSAPRT